MTMPDERSRALVWAGGFLIEIARDKRLPLDVRQSAVTVARHFPTIEQVSHMTLFRHSSGLGMGLEDLAGPMRRGLANKSTDECPLWSEAALSLPPINIPDPLPQRDPPTIEQLQAHRYGSIGHA